MGFKRYYYFIFYSVSNEKNRVFKSTLLKLKYLIEDKETLDLAKIEIAEQLHIGDVTIKKLIPIEDINIINFQYFEPKRPIEYSENERYLYNVVIDCTKKIADNDIKSVLVETDYNVSNFEELKALRNAAINQIKKEYNIELNENDCSLINYCFINQTSISDEDNEQDDDI